MNPLFPNLQPRQLPSNIKFLCQRAEEVDPDIYKRAKLVIADPPWHYGGGLFGGAENASISNQYDSLPMETIAEILRGVGEKVEDCRLAMWATWPLLMQKKGWKDQDISPWRYVTGGSWLKENTGGMGYHWLGVTEPVFIYSKGKPEITFGSLKNGHNSPRLAHSEKPWRWMAQWIEKWTKPGELVIDIFSGRAPAARAAYAVDREYIGIDASQSRIEEGESAFFEFLSNHEFTTKVPLLDTP